MSISSRLPRSRTAMVAAAAGLLVVGGGAGALAVQATRPSVAMAPATPVAIRSLASATTAFGRPNIVTVRGRVAEVYGNMFVMADQTGRALVDTGHEGEDGTLVGTGQTVTVQGRFDHGIVHAAFLVGADGRVAALGPVDRPHRNGPHGHGGPDRDGPDRGGPDRDGPDRDGDRTPPPPPASASAPTATRNATPAT